MASKPQHNLTQPQTTSIPRVLLQITTKTTTATTTTHGEAVQDDLHERHDLERLRPHHDLVEQLVHEVIDDLWQTSHDRIVQNQHKTQTQVAALAAAVTKWSMIHAPGELLCGKMLLEPSKKSTTSTCVALSDR